MKWALGGEYGKIKYVGEDYVEFDIIDVDTICRIRKPCSSHLI